MNILGLEITAAGGKVIGLNPFDDKEWTLATLLDLLGLYAVWLIVWHMLWSLRPKFG